MVAEDIVQPLNAQFPPSEPCSCDICRSYCQRPGWWSVYEAQNAINAGLAGRMMLEVSPEFSFSVLSPAFVGCEGRFATRQFARFGCNFLNNGLCTLYGTGMQPLECRFCHHTRSGLGPKCHTALEHDWNTPAGQALVIMWLCIVRF